MAQLITWSPKLSVGVDSIDSQHQALVGIVNRLNDAMCAGKSADVMGRLLDELITYTAGHFAHEESIMRKHAYPGFAAHKKQHDELVHTALDLQTKFKAGQTRIGIEVMRFLRTWLSEHIQGTDRELGAFCNERMVA